VKQKRVQNANTVNIFFIYTASFVPFQSWLSRLAPYREIHENFSSHTIPDSSFREDQS